jgi:hypothetical protein
LKGLPFTVILINPTGLAGSVPDPVVAVVAEEKFNKFKKNCCHALVGRLVVLSKNSVCG